MLCNNCGNLVDNESKFCEICGAEVCACNTSETQVCSKCQNPIEAGTNFCQVCGNSIEFNDGQSVENISAEYTQQTQPVQPPVENISDVYTNQTSPTGQPVSEVKKSNKVLIIVLSIIIAIALCVGGYFAYIAFFDDSKDVDTEEVSGEVGDEYDSELNVDGESEYLEDEEEIEEVDQIILMYVGDEEVSQAEYSFYYYSLFSNYFNYSYQYDYYYGTGYGAYYIGYDYATAPNLQEYTGTIDGFDAEETPMWTDFFAYSTRENIQFVKACKIYAEENDIELTDEDLVNLADTINSIVENAESSSYELEEYLETYYGIGVTLDLAEEIVTEQILCERVIAIVTQEYADAYSEAEILEEFEDNLETYACVTLRVYASSADDEYVLYENYSYDAASYLEYYEEEFSAWLLDSDTAAGDTFTTDAGTMYYMVEPAHTAQDAYTYAVRHILLSFTGTYDDYEDLGYSDIDFESYANGATLYLDVTMDTAIEQETLYETQKVLVEYLEGDQTAESFGELAVLYTQDSNIEDGGLYEDVAEGDMVEAFENWALTEGREEGDVGIIESDYGYHIMYFVSSTATTWQEIIAMDLATVEATTFAEDIIVSDDVSLSNLSDSSEQEVIDAVIALAENQIELIASY